jgi:hypothetical protein
LDQGLRFSGVVWVASASRWGWNTQSQCLIIPRAMVWWRALRAQNWGVYWSRASPLGLTWPTFNNRRWNGVSLVYARRLALPGELLESHHTTQDWKSINQLTSQPVRCQYLCDRRLKCMRGEALPWTASQTCLQWPLWGDAPPSKVFHPAGQQQGQSFSLDRLKLLTGAQPALPPRRGRPSALASSALSLDDWGLGGPMGGPLCATFGQKKSANDLGKICASYFFCLIRSVLL